MWEISQKMYSFTEIAIFDNSPALPESLPICAVNVKRSRQAERGTVFLPLSSEAVRLSAEIKIKFSHGEKNNFLSITFLGLLPQSHFLPSQSLVLIFLDKALATPRSG